MGNQMNSDYIRGVIDTIILRVLIDKDNYGYEIIKAISKKSHGQFELKEPSLYTSLKRLEKDQMIQSYWGDESLGGRRKYYKVTDLGIKKYQNDLEQWTIAKNIIQQLLERGDENE